MFPKFLNYCSSFDTGGCPHPLVLHKQFSNKSFVLFRNLYCSWFIFMEFSYKCMMQSFVRLFASTNKQNTFSIEANAASTLEKINA